MNAREHLLIAIKSNHYPAVAEFIKLVDHTEVLKDDRTPIQVAYDSADWRCVETIAENKKADAEDKARYGSILLHAVQDNCLLKAKILLEAGASHDWTFSKTGNGCLHLAVQNQNAKMIALLLSFGFDFKKENAEKQTPEQLATSLNATRSLCDGWKMYYDQILVKMMCLTLIQSQRQPRSAFYRIPTDCMDLVTSFLYLKSPPFPALQHSLTKISANCLVTAYSAKLGMFRRHSSTSKRFVAELKNILEAGETESIDKTIETFVKKNKGNKTRTMGLLDKYKLIRPDVSDNKQEITPALAGIRK